MTLHIFFTPADTKFYTFPYRLLCDTMENLCSHNNFYFHILILYTFLHFRSTSDRSGKDCCGQWFNGPPLRFLVILVAFGGVACEFIDFNYLIQLCNLLMLYKCYSGTLGGATLGSIALAGSPTSHLTAGLLMTGKKISFIYVR